VLPDEELSTGVEAKDLVVEFLGDILGLGKGLHAGVVDDDVQLAKGLDGLLEELGDLGGLGDVGLDGDSLAARLLNLRDRRQRRLGRAGIVDDDRRTARSQGLGQPGAETTAGPGDEGDFAVEADA
jgi:hypothetical protein